MARYVVLDSGPLGLLCTRPGVPLADRCRVWLADLVAAGARVIVSAVVDYEVRRELVRVGATAKLRNLDGLRAAFGVVEPTAEVWDQAAEFWAFARRAGLPTAPPEALDADCLLAAQADRLGGAGDVVTIASRNVGHLARFPGIDARDWTAIVP